jgi:hypothetical protein
MMKCILQVLTKLKEFPTGHSAIIFDNGRFYVYYKISDKTRIQSLPEVYGAIDENLKNQQMNLQINKSIVELKKKYKLEKYLELNKLAEIYIKNR